MRRLLGWFSLGLGVFGWAWWRCRNASEMSEHRSRLSTAGRWLLDETVDVSRFEDSVRHEQAEGHGRRGR